MANKVRLKTLISRIRARGEIRDVYVSDDVMVDWINSAVKDLHEQILGVNQDYFVKTSDNISIKSGTDKYSLPEDFASAIKVELLYQGTTDWRKLSKFSVSDMNNNESFAPTRLQWRYRILDDYLYISPTPATTGTVRIWYVPVPPDAVDNEEIDFIYGWDEYVLLECLVRHAHKEESDPTGFATSQARVLDRILSRAKNRDLGEPNVVRDVEREGFYTRFPWMRIS